MGFVQNTFHITGIPDSHDVHISPMPIDAAQTEPQKPTVRESARMIRFQERAAFLIHRDQEHNRDLVRAG
jgi:hypothetical protein